MRYALLQVYIRFKSNVMKEIISSKSKNKPEKWQETYAKLAGNEIHSIIAQNSKFFQEFVGKNFNYASCLAHKK
jgi:hypothetical protein